MPRLSTALWVSIATATVVPAWCSRGVELPGNLPLSFERSASGAEFVCRGASYAVGLRDTELVFASHDSAVTLRFEGSKPGAGLIGEAELQGHVSDLSESDRSRWRINVPTYGRVRRHDLYPGIDLVYYGSGGRLEYDFVVAVGAEPSRIRLSFAGRGRVSIDPDGGLTVSGAPGPLRFEPPRAYQESGGSRREVRSRFMWRGRNAIGIAVGAYDRGKPLVIDPVLSYRTFLSIGGAMAITADASGSVYVTGLAFAFASLPANSGPRLFVAKLNPAGTAMIYTTYFGRGSPLAIAVDAFGSAYVAGAAQAQDEVVARTLIPGSSLPAFAVKINAAGTGISYAVSLGDLWPNVIAVDRLGSAYIAGSTYSSSYPVIGAIHTLYKGNSDGVILRLTHSGSEIAWATFLGGRSTDVLSGMALDAAGNLYVTGWSSSPDFPVTGPSLQPGFTPRLPRADDYTEYGAFAVKINTALPGQRCGRRDLGLLAQKARRAIVLAFGSMNRRLTWSPITYKSEV